MDPGVTFFALERMRDSPAVAGNVDHVEVHAFHRTEHEPVGGHLGGVDQNACPGDVASGRQQVTQDLRVGRQVLLEAFRAESGPDQLRDAGSGGDALLKVDHGLRVHSIHASERLLSNGRPERALMGLRPAAAQVVLSENPGPTVLHLAQGIKPLHLCENLLK